MPLVNVQQPPRTLHRAVIASAHQQPAGRIIRQCLVHGLGGGEDLFQFGVHAALSIGQIDFGVGLSPFGGFQGADLADLCGGFRSGQRVLPPCLGLLPDAVRTGGQRTAGQIDLAGQTRHQAGQFPQGCRPQRIIRPVAALPLQIVHHIQQDAGLSGGILNVCGGFGRGLVIGGEGFLQRRLAGAKHLVQVGKYVGGNTQKALAPFGLQLLDVFLHEPLLVGQAVIQGSGEVSLRIQRMGHDVVIPRPELLLRRGGLPVKAGIVLHIGHGHVHAIAADGLRFANHAAVQAGEHLVEGFITEGRNVAHKARQARCHGVQLIPGEACGGQHIAKKPGILFCADLANAVV